MAYNVRTRCFPNLLGIIQSFLLVTRVVNPTMSSQLTTTQCDLHMPNKDGYQTCKDIREWERQNKYPHLPIIALSANVLGDVYAKCVEAGFNSYLTKPVEFKELSDIMTASLDPSADAKPLRFMQHR